jgi:hypothetical protein
MFVVTNNEKNEVDLSAIIFAFRQIFTVPFSGFLMAASFPENHYVVYRQQECRKGIAAGMIIGYIGSSLVLLHVQLRKKVSVMKRAVLTAALLCATIVNAAVIKGTVVNDASGQPVASATITFRVDNPSTYPVTMTDNNGMFSIDLAVTLPDNYELQLSIEKNGYARKTIGVTVRGDTVNVGTFALKAVSPEEIVVLGLVIDSLTLLPVEGAAITFTKIQGSFTPYASGVTDGAGAFRQAVTLSGEYVIVCTVSKTGYIASSVSITSAMDSVIRTIRLRPEGSIRLNVGGRIVDLKTNEPVAGARVIAYTNYHDAVPDTSYTDSNGVFMRSVQAGTTSSAMPTLVAVISTEGNPDVTITRSLVSADFAGIVLGEIKVTIRNGGDIVGVAPRLHSERKLNSSLRSVVTINGRLCRNAADLWKNAAAPQMLLINDDGRYVKKNMQWIHLNPPTGGYSGKR